jgi:hypothetical protein
MISEELEARLQKIEDILEIEKLGRIYGYYLEHWMDEEIIDLFSDSENVALEWIEGTYIGKKSIRRYFEGVRQVYDYSEFTHQLMQISPVIDIAADGKTAKGRWYGFGAISKLAGRDLKQCFFSGIYENDYVKEGGRWKILRIRWYHNYISGQDSSWTTSIVPKSEPGEPVPDEVKMHPEREKPFGFIMPFHYPHPITGKKTDEAKLNQALKDRKAG